ncbi:hypothetical protein ADL19_31885 [Streptomyces purpurogeneiscleroticus]|nr:hypothetical protein ADL19_31885 [Streptomyces purpurogeneiscleroticus]
MRLRHSSIARRYIYVHAKVLIVDDRLLKIGSSNLNNRSMGLDTECDLAVEAVPGHATHQAVAAEILGLRDALLGEHFGVPPYEVARMRARMGSLIAAVEALRQEGGRTLVPLDGPGPKVVQPLSEGELLDPERPEPVWRAVLHALADKRRRRADLAQSLSNGEGSSKA